MFSDDKLNNHKNEFNFTPDIESKLNLYSESNLLQIVITVELNS